ncbi:MAG: hypothetical protein P0Y49_02495 [Candidatus Pedobacter colombiensis]|uniref:Uncharacterized protein n=1 Tax=Candidatus Pedobacter colombiensis TaxID=3121371 RepID=A0AAJ5WAE6_9SPHI|nr:hypothetical protein [Pedobacter sp.]WEK20021.1 MAG: hypothetical protein P0Y49_02495 [Pedobacter sp.]
MSDSIGEYLRLRLRSKNILNKDAAAYIGLSESAFDKVLKLDDIYPSRLIKLSGLLQENLLEYYHTLEPLKALLEAEKKVQEDSLRLLTDKIELQKQVIDNKEELLMTQRKYIEELETRLKNK